VHDEEEISLISRLSSSVWVGTQQGETDQMADESDDIELVEDEDAELDVDELEDDLALEADDSVDEANAGDDDEDEKKAVETLTAKVTDDDEDEDEDDVEADLDTILKERLATTDDDEDEEETVVIIKSEDGEETAQKRSDEIVCDNCFFIIKETQLGPLGARTCPSGEDEPDCAAIAHFGK
jgi:hypothetical protein